MSSPRATIRACWRDRLSLANALAVRRQCCAMLLAGLSLPGAKCRQLHQGHAQLPERGRGELLPQGGVGRLPPLSGQCQQRVQAGLIRHCRHHVLARARQEDIPVARGTQRPGQGRQPRRHGCEGGAVRPATEDRQGGPQPPDSDAHGVDGLFGAAFACARNAGEDHVRQMTDHKLDRIRNVHPGDDLRAARPPRRGRNAAGQGGRLRRQRPAGDFDGEARRPLRAHAFQQPEGPLQPQPADRSLLRHATQGAVEECQMCCVFRADRHAARLPPEAGDGHEGTGQMAQPDRIGRLGDERRRGARGPKLAVARAGPLQPPS